MHLQFIDWLIVAFTLLICFGPALFFGKRAGKSTSEFFASGRSVPWWLAGLSMVATTFSSDTPNWVTQQVRQYGVAGNWQWWAFVLTGVSTVFFFARLWRRSAVLTTLAKQAYFDMSFFLRPGHLKQLRGELADPEASDNDRFVIYTHLQNAVVAAAGQLPMCQDTGTA